MRRFGLTLIEILISIAVLAVVLAVLVPALQAARRQTRGIVCRSNIRQLVYANMAYVVDNEGFYVPAARDMWNQASLYRWHGTRISRDRSFDPSQGPLAAYLDDGRINQCPEKIRFQRGGIWDENFEQGCGGYGYNMTYLGSRLWEGDPDPVRCYGRSTRCTEVSSSGRTLMFADCALSREDGTFIEYSFAEPPYCVVFGKVMTGFYMSPTLHFRHQGRVNIGWTDGHIASHPMASFDQANVYGVDSAAMSLGWIDPVDNSLFDLR